MRRIPQYESANETRTHRNHRDWIRNDEPLRNRIVTEIRPSPLAQRKRGRQHRRPSNPYLRYAGAVQAEQFARTPSNESPKAPLAGLRAHPARRRHGRHARSYLAPALGHFKWWCSRSWVAWASCPCAEPTARCPCHADYIVSRWGCRSIFKCSSRYVLTRQNHNGVIHLSRADRGS